MESHQLVAVTPGELIASYGKSSSSCQLHPPQSLPGTGVKVVNCGRGCGFVMIFDVVGNCGLIRLMRLKLGLHCGRENPENLSFAPEFTAVDWFLKHWQVLSL